MYRHLSSDRWVMAHAESLIGACLLLQGRFEEAEVALTSAAPILLKERGPDAVETIEVLQFLVALYERTDRPDEAARYAAMLTESANG